MGIILSFICCAIFGVAGWYLYRNPVTVLDFLFRQYDLRYGKLSIGFWRLFGAVMIWLAGLSAIITGAVALTKFWVK